MIKSIIPILLLTILTLETQAQAVADLKISLLEKNLDAVSVTDDTPTGITFTDNSVKAVNYDGMLAVIGGALIYRVTGENIQLETPTDLLNTSLIHLDLLRREVAYVSQDDKQARIPFINPMDGKINSTYEITKHSAEEQVTHFSAENYTKSFVYVYRDDLGFDNVYDVCRYHDGFCCIRLLDRVDEVQDLFLSSSANRLYYNAIRSATQSNGQIEAVQLPRGNEGWEYPDVLDIPTIEGEKIKAIANDGKTVLLETSEQNLVMIYEIHRREWSLPELVDVETGDYGQCKMSEDGQIIVVSTAKRAPKAEETEADVPYDLYTYTKSEETGWTKQKINASDKALQGGDFLFSGDGKTLIWAEIDVAQAP